MKEFLNKKYWKLTVWQWGLVVIALILILSNMTSVLSALVSIFLVIGLACIALAIISWLTHRPKMSTKFGIVAAISLIIMYIFSLIKGK